MRRTPARSSRLICLMAFAVAGLLAGSRPAAQQPPAPQAPQRPLTPRAAAPYDLTGYWVSVVTEDWRWRMVTPPKGDYISIPLSDEGRRVAFAWDPQTDGSCQAYRRSRPDAHADAPQHLLAGRRCASKSRAMPVSRHACCSSRRRGRRAPRSLQGFSVAEWEPLGVAGAGRAGGPAAAQGAESRHDEPARGMAPAERRRRTATRRRSPSIGTASRFRTATSG